MTKLTWDGFPRPHEVGVDRGVVYLAEEAHAWTGLTAVSENPEMPDVKARYLDGQQLGASRRSGVFAGTLEALTYPSILDATNRLMGMSYRTMTEEKYRLHVVYNLLLSPTAVPHAYDSPITFAWEFTTLPRELPGYRKTSHMIIEADVAYSQTLKAVEDVLYGTELTNAFLPSPEEILWIFEENSILQIIDHGDGNWTAIGPDSVISMLDADTFEIDYVTAIYLDPETYTVHSL